MKRIAQVMCLVVAMAGLPRMVEASGDKATKSEMAELAAWETQAPEVVTFEGGDAAGTLLFIVVVAAIAVLIYMLMDHHHAMTPVDGGGAPPAPLPPPLFR